MSKKDEPLTRAIIRSDIEEIVGRVVGEIATDILSMMDDRFKQVDKRFEAMDKRFEKIEGKLDQMDGRMNRMENILRPTAEKVDDHEVRIKRLEAGAAA